MIGFQLTDQQKSLQETARKFARQEMMPLAAKFDQSMEYPWEVIKKAHETGLLNVSLPEKVGGMGLPLLDQMIIGEEIAYGCAGMQTAMGANDLALGPLLVAGTDAQLAARGRFTDGTERDLTADARWSAGDTGILTVANVAARCARRVRLKSGRIESDDAG